MKNPENWEPTNIVRGGNDWVPNLEYIAPWSKHVTSLECRAYIDTLRKHAKGDLLDVGAGTVPYYGVYKDQVKSVTTLDWHNTIHGNSQIDIVDDANEGLPFEDESFDTVLLADVIEHIRQPETLFKHVSRVMRGEGKAIVFVPFMYGVHEAPHDYYRYTKFALEDLFKRNGLDTTDLKPYGGGPDVVVDLVEKMTYNNKILRSISNSAIRTVVDTEVYKNARIKYQDRFPIGYVLVGQKSSRTG